MVSNSPVSFLAGFPGAAPRGPEQGRSALDLSDSANLFGFTGTGSEARVLSVPLSSGDSAAQLQARFIDCLFSRA